MRRIPTVDQVVFCQRMRSERPFEWGVSTGAGGGPGGAYVGDRLGGDIDQGAFQFGRFHRLVQDRAVPA